MRNFPTRSCGASLTVWAGETLAIWLWAAGAIITLFLNFAILLRFFLHPGLEIDHMTPIFFIPVAGLVVVPVAGAQICSMLNPLAADIAIIICVLSLGGGFVLYLGLLCIMLQRHLLAAPLPDQLSPTFWIHMAPIGWGSVSLTRFAQHVAGSDFGAAAQLGALLLFGGALWWLIMAALICCVAMARHKMTFNLAWWSFVFPTGSLAILSKSLDLPAASGMFPFLYLLLAGLWTACAFNTLFQGAIKMSQFRKTGPE